MYFHCFFFDFHCFNEDLRALESGGRLAYCELIPGHIFSFIFMDFRRISTLRRVGEACTLSIVARTCIFIDVHGFFLVFIDFRWI